MRAPAASLLARPLLLLAPLLLPWLLPLGLLTPAVAYVVTEGEWLVVLGAVCALISLAIAVSGWQPAPHVARVSAAIAGLAPRTFATLLWLLAFGGMLVAIPGHRFTGDSLGGDEPKYLRLAESLYRDLDVDVASESQAPLTPGRFLGNLRALTESTAHAFAGLWRHATPPDGHQWNRGNWTLAGRNGGLYHIQSPGLPLLLLPGLVVQRTFMPEHDGPLLPMLTLAALWATALLQSTLLVERIAGSRPLALLAASALAISAPVFVGGYHFYPEVAAAAAVPWLLRHALPTDAPVYPLRSAALFLVAGSLPWLHPKFLLLSLVLLGALVIRSRRAGWLVLAALPLLALLLFDHHVTGLLRPDAFYQRYGSEVYAGTSSFLSFNMVRGALNALVVARDGILLISPVAIAGVLAVPLLAREQRRIALVLAAAFGSLWLAAAVHNGGAPGPPGRLMAPVACILAVPLGLGLRRLRGVLAYRWTTALLLILTALVTLAMLGDWRRSVKPYRRMFPPGTNFARDLPGGPLEPGDPPSARRRSLDIARGVTLVAIVGFWVWRFSRVAVPPALAPAQRWQAIRNVHLGWWATVLVASATLRALGP